MKLAYPMHVPSDFSLMVETKLPGMDFTEYAKRMVLRALTATFVHVMHLWRTISAQKDPKRSNKCCHPRFRVLRRKNNAVNT